MRNTDLGKLDGLVGTWTTTLSDAWFLEPAGTTVPGTTTVEWIAESFLLVHTQMGADGQDTSEMRFVLGRSDANDRYVALYHDDRGVCREFTMEFVQADGAAARWTLVRTDPDFHQRFDAEVGPDRIAGRWEASEDAGATWRKDFDLTFTRA